MSELSFKKHQRLVKNSQFVSVLSNRKCVKDDQLLVCIKPNGQGYNRLGISVGKSLGSSVMRNRFKRFIRESFRLEQHNIGSSVDYLVMPSPAIKEADRDKRKAIVKNITFSAIHKSFLTLAKTIGQ